MKPVKEKEKTTEQNNVEIVRSPFKQFRKSTEFVVLKGLAFKIQSVSTKKIILKLNGKAQEGVPDGIFCIKPKEETPVKEEGNKGQ